MVSSANTEITFAVKTNHLSAMNWTQTLVGTLFFTFSSIPMLQKL